MQRSEFDGNMQKGRPPTRAGRVDPNPRALTACDAAGRRQQAAHYNL